MIIITESGPKLIRATAVNRLEPSNVIPQRHENDRIAALNDWNLNHNKEMAASQRSGRNLDYVHHEAIQNVTLVADSYSLGSDTVVYPK